MSVGWDDPLDFEAGSSTWPIYDGNHRLAAAFYLRLPEVVIFSWRLLECRRRIVGRAHEEIKRSLDAV